MVRTMQGVAVVVFCILLGGALGGIVGLQIGRVSPSFVRLLTPVDPGKLPPDFQPAEYGVGLGIVSGLIFGAGTGAFVVLVTALHDAWVAGHQPAGPSRPA